MWQLLSIEWHKLWRLATVRLSLLLFIIFPIVWAYAPGVVDVYGFYIISAYQVPALSLLSSMEFLLPLLVAIVSASLLGVEVSYHTLPTVLLRPVSRSKLFLAKLSIAVLFPFILLAFLLVTSLFITSPVCLLCHFNLLNESICTNACYGYGAFIGGTGLGAGELVGVGEMLPLTALKELGIAYALAAASLVPISCLAMFFTVVFGQGVSGALATIALLIFMRLLVVWPQLERYLLTTHLNAYVHPTESLGWTLAGLGIYGSIFAAWAMFIFERKDI